jgi:hypothetical protein
VGIGAGYAVRFLLVEPETLGQTCAALAAPPWCLPRQAVIWFFHQNVIGLAAVAAGVLALLGPRRPGWAPLARRFRARPAALVLGGLALVLYNAGLGSVAVVLGIVAAADDFS